MKALFGILLLCSFLAVQGQFKSCDSELDACREGLNCTDGEGYCKECLQNYYNCAENANCDTETKYQLSLDCEYYNYKRGCDNDCPPRNVSECRASLDPCEFNLLDCLEISDPCNCAPDYIDCVRSFDCYDEEIDQKVEELCDECELDCGPSCEDQIDDCNADYQACQGDDEEPNCECVQSFMDCAFATSCDQSTLSTLTIACLTFEGCQDLECHAESSCVGDSLSCINDFLGCQGDNEDFLCECSTGFVDCLSGLPCTKEEQEQQGFYEYCLQLEGEGSCGINCAAAFGVPTTTTEATSNTKTTENGESTASTKTSEDGESTTITGNTGTTDNPPTGTTESTEQTKQTQSSDQDVDDAGKLYAVYSLVTIAVIYTSVF